MGAQKSRFFGATKVNTEHIQNAFREYFKNEDLVVNVEKLERLPTRNASSSYVIRLFLKWTKTGVKEAADLPNTVILKVPEPEFMAKTLKIKTTETNSERTNRFVIEFHDSECLLYQTFQQHGPPPVSVPVVYAAWDSKTAMCTGRPLMILMEDPSIKACNFCSPADSLNYEQLKSAVASLADIHAWSWRNPHILDKFDDIVTRTDYYNVHERGLINDILIARENYPTIFETIDEIKLLILILRGSRHKRRYDPEQCCASVLMHGEFCASSIMFEKLSDGKSGSKIVALIDWQKVMKGNMCRDFARVISENCSPELHEQHYEELKKHYFEQLTEKVGSENMPERLTWEALSELLDDSTAWYGLFKSVNQQIILAKSVRYNKKVNEEEKQRIISHCRYRLQFGSKFFDLKK